MTEEKELQELLDDIDDFEIEEVEQFFEVWMLVKNKFDIDIATIPVDIGYTDYEEAKKCYDYVVENFKDLEVAKQAEEFKDKAAKIEIVLISTIDGEIEECYDSTTIS